ncbi:LAMI_0F07360g1_1 [Lachancea mirantina]|uniref:LAMI_0F07360g1_1 n=1 Tax=Lachancea mirantina TaxID=1230905 RepID=A0A1G4JZK3_9SACH|nr:LAMI_0F07360g1_1 [Lachancea mirantina]
MLQRGFRRSASTFQQTDRKILDFYNYHATNAALKPLIYRPKNKNLLLAMDLKDPESNAPLKARTPVKPLSKDVLNSYIWSAQEASQVLGMVRKWTSLTTRKKAIWQFFNASHVQNMLFAANFKLGKFSAFVREFYALKPRFESVGSAAIYDVEHFFNSLITCSLHKNAAQGTRDADVGLKKLTNAWNHVAVKNDDSGLAGLLIAAYAKQQGITSEALTSLETPLPSITHEIKLPTLMSESMSIGITAKLVSENRFKYVMTRTILQYGDACLANDAIQKFVSEYQLLQSKLDDKKDVYETYCSVLKSVLTEQHPPTVTHKHPVAGDA